MSMRASARVRGRSRVRVTVAAVALQRDTRGRVFEPLAPARLHGQQQAHGVIIEPDGLRGCRPFSASNARPRGLSRFASFCDILRLLGR
jgi:hypothetical protein